MVEVVQVSCTSSVWTLQLTMMISKPSIMHFSWVREYFNIIMNS